jgi:hypothetical protein
MPATTTLHEHALGLSWVVDEPMERASHAVADDDGRMWLVDVVDDAAAMARIADLGTPAAVVQLLDRHPRDCAAVAARLGVPHLRLPSALPGSPFEVHDVVQVPRWREVALWWPGRKALVVAEAVGTGRYFAVGSGPVGVHPWLRMLPPRGSLGGLEPDVLLTGHGPPLTGPGTAEALREALDRSRRDVPKMLGGLLAAARR